MEGVKRQRLVMRNEESKPSRVEEGKRWRASLSIEMWGVQRGDGGRGKE